MFTDGTKMNTGRGVGEGKKRKETKNAQKRAEMQKRMRLRGIEPRCIRWQRTVLAIGPQTLFFVLFC